jgi:dipeptidyl aminopeptidase/acylaminoacyl peptidase
VSGPRELPYGTWPSPISAERVARGGVRLSEPWVEGETVYWLESRPAEEGRSVVCRADPWSGAADVTPAGFNARDSVHEYGGGSYAVRDGVVFFTHFADERIYRQDPGSAPAPITPEPPQPRSVRHADLEISPDGRLLACVRERHAGEGLPENELVILPTDGGAAPLVVASGRDFYAAPRFSPDGRRLAWLEWDLPNMPWDGCELLVAEVREGGALGPPRRVAGGPSESIFQPSWSPQGLLHFVSDRTGWWNLYREEPDGTQRNLTPIEAELGVPAWEFRYATHAHLADGRIACASRRGGVHHLGLLDPETGELLEVDLPFGCFDPPYVRADGTRVAVLAASPTEPPQIVTFDVATRAVDVLRVSEERDIDPGYLSVPEPVEFPTEGGTAHMYVYPPTNRDVVGPPGERPPLIVHAHGGPTSEAVPELDLRVQYFTSRGFAYADVNYGGSSGYGRAYRERLDGRWGIVDVIDCVNAARFLVERGDADPERLIVTGGSAGGWTTLCALTFHDVFACGTSSYGVSDLEPFTTITHKFEFKYIDRLVGPWPEAAEVWRERSPVRQAQRIRRPVLVLQGTEDAVVPPSQSEAIVAALRENGVPHAYLTFEGEQHGWRRAETIRRALEAELAFYGEILGFEPADELPGIPIEGLS